MRWLRIEHFGGDGRGQRWAVFAKRGNAPLGEVAWFARWRRFAFAPFLDTVYEQDCLRDLAAFVEARTKELHPTTDGRAVMSGDGR